MSRQPPAQQPPPVQRLRIQYTKLGPARYASHRDFARAFERSLRRAGVPMAYSSGFSPHPRISYANAAATGAATHAEYLEIGLAQVCDPVLVRQSLDAALPPGMAVLRVVVATGAGLAERLTASRWLLELPEADPVLVADAVAALMGSDLVEVERQAKSGLRRFDVRGALVSAHVTDNGDIELLLRHETPLVRPDDVVAALAQLRPELAQVPVLVTRLSQGRLGQDDELIDPLQS